MIVLLIIILVLILITIKKRTKSGYLLDKVTTNQLKVLRNCAVSEN